MSAMPIDLEENTVIEGARIKVIGVGGGGNNAVDRMIEAGVTKAEFICVNTDAQQLSNVKAPTVLQIGAKLTNGLGAGAKPEIGRQAAEETKDEIKNLVKDAAKSAGILTVAVVTKPFSFEGPQRMRNAEEGIKNLAERVDSIVTIPNDLLLKIADKKVTINDSFKLADDILRQGVQGIIEIITQKGIVNCDFADVRTIMKDSGVAHMGIGIGKGENAAQDAVRAAVESPLLETSIAGAENVLLNITGGTEFSLVDMGEVSTIIKDMVSDEANIIVGSALDETMKDEIKVTLIATGLDGSLKRNSDAGVKPKTSTQSQPSAASYSRQERRQPSSYSSSVSDYDDDSIFKRRLRPGMSDIDVPGFFKR